VPYVPETIVEMRPMELSRAFRDREKLSLHLPSCRRFLKFLNRTDRSFAFPGHAADDRLVDPCAPVFLFLTGTTTYFKCSLIRIFWL